MAATARLEAVVHLAPEIASAFKDMSFPYRTFLRRKQRRVLYGGSRYQDEASFAFRSPKTTIEGHH
jgi:hypothetical protein